MNEQDSEEYLIPRSSSQKVIQPPEATPVVNYPYDRTHQPTSHPVQPAPIKPTKLMKDNQTVTYSADAEPMTNTTRLQNHIYHDAQLAADQILSAERRQAQEKQQEKQAQDLARQRYHQAWQNYYQKYYENYYIAALQEQQARFAKQQAAVADSRQNDGVLDQSEVQHELKSEVLEKVKETAEQAKRHWWFWPAISAAVVALVFFFLQYNSVVMAGVVSFISPGDSSTQTIIVGSGSNQPISTSPHVIIPKINVNAPVVYGLTDLSENNVQVALRNGPVHYPLAGATATPGQKGNTVILGHSSADVFAPGDYKFIFVQLNRLTQGDLFYLDYGKTRYAYKVVDIKSIYPNQIDRVNLGSSKAYATLITCDPPGSIAKRLLVIGEQVSPDPNRTGESQETTSNKPAKQIVGKPKTLLESIFGK